MNVSFLTVKCVVPLKSKNRAELWQSCEIKKGPPWIWLHGGPGSPGLSSLTWGETRVAENPRFNA